MKGTYVLPFTDINKVFDELKCYLSMPISSINDLTVFEINDLLDFMHLAANEWISKWDRL